jgi:hypothetical protein
VLLLAAFFSSSGRAEVFGCAELSLPFLNCRKQAITLKSPWSGASMSVLAIYRQLRFLALGGSADPDLF